MKLSGDQVVGLIQLGWVVYSKIHDAVVAGKVAIQRPDGTVVTGAEAMAALDAAIAASLAAGDAAADRIEGRG